MYELSGWFSSGNYFLNLWRCLWKHLQLNDRNVEPALYWVWNRVLKNT